MRLARPEQPPKAAREIRAPPKPLHCIFLNMCGRFTLKRPVAEVAELLEAAVPGDLDFLPRYNIAPTQPILAARTAGPDGERELSLLRWGLIPSWVQDPADWPTLLNARAETLHRKPAFQEAVRFRRCVVPADGFYEWRTVRGGKQPYYIRHRDDDLLTFAGLWDRWRGPDDSVVESCTIVTTDANELLRPLHDRMPVILDAAGRERWLDPDRRSYRELEPLLRPCSPDRLLCYPVSRAVNRVDFDGPECIEPVEPSVSPPRHAGPPEESTLPESVPPEESTLPESVPPGRGIREPSDAASPAPPAGGSTRKPPPDQLRLF